MPQNGKKAAAVLSAGALAAGAAKVSGVLDGAAHTAGESRGFVHEPFSRRDPIPPTRDTPLPTGGVGEAAGTHTLISEGEDDVTAKDVICFAYEHFVDNDVFTADSPDDFAAAVFEQLAPEGSGFSYRQKAYSLYAALNDPDTDWSAVALELGCFGP